MALTPDRLCDIVSHRLFGRHGRDPLSNLLLLVGPTVVRLSEHCELTILTTQLCLWVATGLWDRIVTLIVLVSLRVRLALGLLTPFLIHAETWSGAEGA